MVNPFSVCGKDYFEPFQVKHFQKTVKKWVCLFTCFSTSAFHLEIVSTLETQSCSHTIHRFVARRGCPEIFLSDNVILLVGAARGLCALFVALNGTQLEQHAVKLSATEKFNPPGTADFGGV